MLLQLIDKMEDDAIRGTFSHKLSELVADLHAHHPELEQPVPTPAMLLFGRQMNELFVDEGLFLLCVGTPVCTRSSTVLSRS